MTRQSKRLYCVSSTKRDLFIVKTMKEIFVCLLMIIVFSCSKNECTYNDLQTIRIDEGNNNGGKVVTYHLLSDGLSRDCLDSFKVLSSVNRYLSVADKRVRHIHIYDSIEIYDKGETTSQSPAFYENEILLIDYQYLTGNIERFTFYDINGSDIYSGRNWTRK